MYLPPTEPSPFVGVDNPAVPPTVGGVFNAWGNLRLLWNKAVPSFTADMDGITGYNSGVFV